jgi:hypothetical protein
LQEKLTIDTEGSKKGQMQMQSAGIAKQIKSNQKNQLTLMRLGASSGVDLGKVTVRMPFSIDAFISSS